MTFLINYEAGLVLRRVKMATTPWNTLPSYRGAMAVFAWQEIRGWALGNGLLRQRDRLR
jgi:hypothetical protein